MEERTQTARELRGLRQIAHYALKSLQLSPLAYVCTEIEGRWFLGRDSHQSVSRMSVSESIQTSHSPPLASQTIGNVSSKR